MIYIRSYDIIHKPYIFRVNRSNLQLCKIKFLCVRVCAPVSVCLFKGFVSNQIVEQEAPTSHNN